VIWSIFEAVVNGRNDSGASMKDIENNNENTWRRKTATDVMQGKEIGDLPIWWSDTRYAQQQFMGTNPTTGYLLRVTLTSPVPWVESPDVNRGGIFASVSHPIS